MNNNKKLKTIKEYTISGSFSVFATVVLIVTLLMMLIFGYFSYKSHINCKYEQLESVGRSVDYLLAESFDKSDRIMTYIGRHINEKNYKDLDYIHSLFKKTSGREYKASQILSWTMFNWVDNKDFLSVTRMNGVIRNPSNMAHREYTWKCKASPWTLQFSSPTIGMPSGEWIIPAGIGITSSNDEFLGIIAVGFNILDLTEMLLDKTRSEKVSFLVLDNNLAVVLDSDRPNYFETDSKRTRFTKDQLQFAYTQQSGFLNNKLQNDKTTYFYYNKMSDFPYTILIGMDYGTWIKDFILMILPSMLQILSLGVFSTILIYISRKKIIDIGRNATRAKEDLAANINKRSQIHMDTILQYSDILMRHLNGEIHVGIDKSRQIEFLKHIQKSAAAAKHVDKDTLKLATIDLNSLLNNSLDIHGMTVLQKNIVINKKLHSEPLLISGDLLFINQIVIGLLSHSINHAPLASDIFVTTFAEQGQAVLEVIYSSVDLNHTNFELESAVKLVEIHGGTLNIKSKGIIKIITLDFPVPQKKQAKTQNMI